MLRVLRVVLPAAFGCDQQPEEIHVVLYLYLSIHTNDDGVHILRLLHKIIFFRADNAFFDGGWR